MALKIAVANLPNAPLINGRAYSHQSISFTVNGIQYRSGLVSVNYASKLNPQALKTTSGRPVAFTLGTLEETSDFELASQWGKQLIAQLGPGYGVRFQTIIVQRSETDDLGSDDTQTDTIIARIKGPDQSSSSGNGDPSTIKFEMQPAQIKINGIDVLPQGR